MVTRLMMAYALFGHPTLAPAEVPAGNPIADIAHQLKQARDAGAGSDGGLAEPPKPSAPDAGAYDAGAAKAAVVPMTPDVKELVDRVQGFYEKTQDFTADFRQDYLYKTFKRTQTSTGTVTYKKPALMRWEYEKPSKRTFVLAGERVYALDPEAKLLTRASIATNTLSASVTFLWGQGKLADEFNIAKKACEACTGTLLELLPIKPDPRFQRVLLEVDPKTAQVRKSTVVDPDGSENAITFSKLVTNTGIDEKTFKLSPPPGTQVQDFMGGTPGPAEPKQPIGIGEKAGQPAAPKK